MTWKPVAAAALAALAAALAPLPPGPARLRAVTPAPAGVQPPASGSLGRRPRSLAAARAARADPAAGPALAAACRRLAAELRAGVPPATALDAAARGAPPRLAAAFARAAAAERLGADAAAELSAGSPALRPLGAVWRVSRDAGAGAADALERLAAALDDALRLREELAAALAGPRASAVLLAVLPGLGLGVAAAAGAHPLRFLLGTPAGAACLVAGVALDLAGLVWTRRLVRGVTG